MLIFIDLGDNTSENNSFNPMTNFLLHSVMAIVFSLHVAVLLSAFLCLRLNVQIP